MRRYTLTPEITQVATLIRDMAQGYSEATLPQFLALLPRINLEGWHVGNERWVLDPCELSWALDEAFVRQEEE